MKKITHPVYEDYPEQPYIAPDRDLTAWIETPERFPYQIVERRQMQRLPEGILPGHIVMLWRIGFDNFTNESVIPQYFEYRYGVESGECIKTLLRLGYVTQCSAKDTLDLLIALQLKRILTKYKLDTKGKKAELLQRVDTHLTEEQLAEEYPLRRYRITPKGRELLAKYDDIIQRHGPKM